MRSKTEIKHCCRCSREITVILFPFYFMLCEPLMTLTWMMSSVTDAFNAHIHANVSVAKK